MGLYVIPVKREMIEKIPDLISSIGFPVTQIIEDSLGTHYFYKHPKRPNQKFEFWITPLSQTHSRQFEICMSRSAEKIVEALNVAKVFVEP